MSKQTDFNDHVIQRMDDIENTQDGILGVIALATVGAIVAIPCLAISGIVKAVKKHKAAKEAESNNCIRSCNENEVEETDLEVDDLN